ncbi:MAG: radical SAM protein, partial [Candidatus Omnitrophica bacterium]|nr:radical SAM protein [Candidatus Omnitrophota bacterium]
MRRVSFFTLGCKVNQYETQSIRESFLERGFLESAENDSDWCVINTCTVTSSADAKSRNIIRHLIRKNPDSKIVVTGCLVAKDHKTLSEIKGIDYIISKSFFADSISDFKGRTRAFLKIQDGCDNFCSYCKVPYVRGLSRSRPEKDIINEAGLLAKKGFREVVLTGICLGSYPGLARLV